MISIRIGNEILDSKDDEVLALTYSTNEIGKLESRQGSFSNSYSLAWTNFNLEKLGFPNLFNLSDSNPYEKIECELLNKGLLIDKGFLRIDELNENESIQVTFFGTNVDWFNQVKDFKLADIDLSAIDHTYNSANIIASWAHDYTDGYVYPFVDYGREIVVPGTSVEDWLPGVFVRYLIQKGLEQKGFKIGGSLLRESIFNKTIIPFSKELFLSSERLFELETSAQNFGVQTVPTITEQKIDFVGKVDPNSNWDIVTNERFTATSDISAYVKINFSSLIASGTSGGFLLRVKKNGVQIRERGFIASSFFETPHSDEFQVDLVNTDYLEFFIYNAHTSNLNIGLLVCQVNTSNYIIEGGNIPMSFQMVDMEFTDLLKWVAFTFGVVFNYDRFTKTINFNLFKDLKQNISTAQDWSDKLIKVKRTEYLQPIADYGRVNRIEYLENEDDFLLNAYKVGTGTNYGDGIININNDFLSGEKVIYKAPFAGTVSGNRFGEVPTIPRYSSLSLGVFEADIDPKPRVMVYHGSRTMSSFSFLSGVTISGSANQTSVGYATFFKDTFGATINGFTQSLAYSTPISPNPNDVPIFETDFWNLYLNILSKPVFLLCELFLTENDINILDFTKPVYIESLRGYFYINKVKEYTGEGTTEVELIRL